MDPISVLLGIVVVGGLYLAYQSGALASFGGPASGPTVQTPTGETVTGTPAAQIVTGGSAVAAASAQGAVAASQGQAQVAQINQNTTKTVISAVAGGASVGVGIATTTSLSLTTAAMTAGITAGIGIVVGIALALWSKHEARIAGAQKEDAAWNEIMPGFVEMMQGIANAYNSGQIDRNTAAAEVLAAKQYTYSAAQKFVGTPGTDWVGGNTGKWNGQAVPIGLSTRNYWQATCDKHCTIGCCLWNGVIGPVCNKTMDLFAGTGSTVGQSIHIPNTQKSSYGYTGTAQVDIPLTR